MGKQLQNCKLLFTIPLFTIVFLNACKKIDTSSDYQQESIIDITNRFFTTPPNTDPLVIKVIAEIKNRNNTKEFVNSFANNIGFPIWDKAIITTVNAVSNSGNFANTNSLVDTFAYIPFAKNDSNSINGYILAKLNTNLSLRYTLAQDYKLCSFVIKQNDLNDASKLALRMIYLNKVVFGTTNYKITDTRLFSNDTINKKIIRLDLDNTLSNQQNFVSSLTCTITITTTTTCITRCHTTVSSTIFCENEWPGGGDAPPGGGGGGGDITPNFPCTPIPNPNFTGQSNTGSNSIVPGDPLPNCTPIGTGWTTNPTTPCEKIDMLKDNPIFASLCSTLKDSTSKNHEIGFSYEMDSISSITQIRYFKGVNNKHEVKCNPYNNRQLSGWMHNHRSQGGLKIFSAEDLYAISNFYYSGLINPSNFSLTVVTDSGTYVMVVNDINQFNTFINNYYGDDEQSLKLDDKYDNAGIGNNIPIVTMETRFLKFMNSNNMGLSIFKANANFTNFSQMVLTQGTNLQFIPCN